jgi:hypothetical protein
MPVFSCGGMRYQFKWQDVPESEIPADNQRNLEATINRAVLIILKLPVVMAVPKCNWEKYYPNFPGKS